MFELLHCAARCWVCLGRGYVDGLYHRERCPNRHCPHRPASDKQLP